MIGTGTELNAFRSALTPYITFAGDGSGFWDWVHEARLVRYCLSRADPAKHALAAADVVNITPYSAELADLAALNAWLDATLVSVPLVVKNQLESDGFSIAWAIGTTTRREAFRYISKVHVMMQELRRLADTDSLTMFQQGLDTTIGALSVQVRNKVATWMTNHGLDTSWIVGATTVRAVIHYVLTNINWPVMNFGPYQL